MESALDGLRGALANSFRSGLQISSTEHTDAINSEQEVGNKDQTGAKGSEMSVAGTQSTTGNNQERHVDRKDRKAANGSNISENKERKPSFDWSWLPDSSSLTFRLR